MSGSAENRQPGLSLIVPAIVLILPAIVLIWSLLALPASEPVAAPPATEEVVAAEAIVDQTSDLVEASLPLDLPTIEEVSPPPAIAAVSTPPTAPPVVMPTPRTTPTPTTSWAGPQTFTFVALGVDQRNDREIPRTDTIMLGKVDLRTPKISLISIPRDLLVEIPGYGKDRINAAYVYGEQYKEPGGGIGLLQRTLEKSFWVKLDHFGMVDFQCFRTTVDAIGGLTVNVPRAIVDPSYPTEDYGTKLVKFEPGSQLMDGERALEYARTRSADSDFHRIQRQQLIVAAMRDRMLSLRTMPSVPTMLTGCRNMRSDLGWREYLNLATSLQSLNSNRVSFAAIDEKMVVDSTLVSGAAVLIPRWEPIRQLVSETFTPGATDATTRTGATSSPTPVLPGASPAPLPFPSPSPLPMLPGESIARPAPTDFLPGDAPMLSVPSTPPPRRT